jgi:hypothetical protein
VFAEENAPVARAERERSKPKRTITRYYYDDEPRYERQQRGFLFFGR